MGSGRCWRQQQVEAPRSPGEATVNQRPALVPALLLLPGVPVPPPWPGGEHQTLSPLQTGAWNEINSKEAASPLSLRFQNPEEKLPCQPEVGFHGSSSSSIPWELVMELLPLHSPKPGRRESTAQVPNPLLLPCHPSCPGIPAGPGHTLDTHWVWSPQTLQNITPRPRMSPQAPERHPKPQGPHEAPAHPRLSLHRLALPDTSCQQRNPQAPGTPSRSQGLALTLDFVTKGGRPGDHDPAQGG